MIFKKTTNRKKKTIEKWISNYPKEDKDDKMISMQLSLVPHLLRDNANNMYAEDKECILWLPGIEINEFAYIFEDFVDEQAFILARVSRKCTTQSAESFMKRHGIFSPKKKIEI